jgi:hypothetical protein
MVELDMVAGATPFHAPAFIQKSALNIARGHRTASTHSNRPLRQCVFIHTESLSVKNCTAPHVTEGAP